MQWRALSKDGRQSRDSSRHGLHTRVFSLPRYNFGVHGYYGRASGDQKGEPRVLEAGVQFGGHTTDLS